MKQIKLYVVILLLVVLVVPSVALAAWWNPFSWNWNIFDWFSKPQITKIQPGQNSANFLDQIKNYAYDVSLEGLYFAKGMFGPQDANYNPKALQLTNGTYSWGPDHTDNSVCSWDTMHLVSIAQNSSGQPLYVIGDLNGDGKDDAVVMLNLEYKEYNKTGSQSFCSGSAEDSSELMLIALISNNGQLKQTDSYMNGRPGLPKTSDISNITINNGVININGKNTQQYKLVNGKIVIAGKSFQTPVLPANLKTYTVNNFGFSFQYPANLNFTVQDVQPPTLFGIKADNTNNNPLTLSVNAEDFSSCIGSVIDGGLATELMINGIPFYITTGGDAAMGTYSSAIQYSTFKNGKCYQVGLQYFTHSCGNYLPLESGNAQQAKNYNDCLANNKSAEALSSIPDIIVSTFKFNPDMVQTPAPTCSIQANKQSYNLGDVINLTWQSQNATGAFWNQPIETGGTRKNIVPPQGNPPTSGTASTVANIEGNQTINLKVSGLGGIADCSVKINVAAIQVAKSSITIDSGTISSTPNGAGNADVIIKGTATNGALYNDDINLVLFDPNYTGPFDEATIYSNGLRSKWFSGGAAIELRQDNVPFENWSVKTYAPAGTASVRVLAYPLYSSSTTSPTQPIANTVINLSSSNSKPALSKTQPSVSEIWGNGIVGNTIAIVGKGFDATNNSVVFTNLSTGNSGYSINLPSSNGGTTIAMTIPPTLSGCTSLPGMGCTRPPEQNLQLGNYDVQVETASGMSNSVVFVINNRQSKIAVTSPNGGELWAQGSTHKITWTTTDLQDSSTVVIALLNAGSINNQPIIIANNLPANSDSYFWTIPSSIAVSPSYIIQIYQTSSPYGNSGYGNSYFSVVNP